MAKKKNYRLCCIIANRKLSRIGKFAKSDAKKLDRELTKLQKSLKSVR
jgi:hypothetical protein